MDDNGTRCWLLNRTCLYLEAGYTEAESRVRAQRDLDRALNHEVQLDTDEDRDGLYR
jgi:hypothetical protein